MSSHRGIAAVWALAVAAVACVDERESVDDDIGETSQAVTSLPSFGSGCSATGECAVQITVPQGVPETEIVLSGSSFVHLNDGTSVSSIYGLRPVSSSGGNWSRIGVDANVGHFLSPFHRLQVGNTNTPSRALYGDIYSGDGIYDFPITRQLAQDRITVLGEVIEGLDNPRQPRLETHTIWSFQWPPELEGFDLNSIPIDSDGFRALPPRSDVSYPALTADWNHKIRLVPGTYFIRSITVNSPGTVMADTSTEPGGEGEEDLVRVAVAGLTLNDRVYEKRRVTTGGQDQPSRFLMAMVGTGSVNATAGFEGVLVAPFADVSFWGRNGNPALYGAGFGQGLEVHQYTKVRQGFDPGLLVNPATISGPSLPDDSKTKYVRSLGYLDGRSCEHWPVDLRPASFVNQMAVGTDADTQNSTTLILNELKRATRSDNPTVTTFGSMSELALTSYVEYSEADRSLMRRMVAVDTDTLRGYDISYARLCREEADLKQNACMSHSHWVLIRGVKTQVSILGRAEEDHPVARADEIAKTVELVAPRILVEPPQDLDRLYGHALPTQRVEFDTNLILAAESIAGNEQAFPSPIELEVRPHSSTTPSTWSSDMVEESHPGFIALLASSIDGIGTVAAVNGARVGSISCYPDTDYTVDSLMANWRTSYAYAHGYVSHTHPQLQLASGLLPSAIPVRGTAEQGGHVAVLGNTGSDAVSLLALGMPGIRTFGCPLSSSTDVGDDGTAQHLSSSTVGLRAAQILSKGLLFRGMVRDAQTASALTSEGQPSDKYVHLNELLSLLAPEGTTTTGIDAATQGEVRGLAYANQTDASVSLNALGVTYGAVAKPWLPNSVEPGAGRTVNEIRDRWRGIWTTANTLNDAMGDQAESAELLAMVTSIRALATGLDTYTSQIHRAAVEDQLGQAEASANLGNALLALGEAQQNFQLAMCDALHFESREIPCDWVNIAQDIGGMARGLLDRCTADNASNPLLDMFTSLASMVPYVQAGVTAFDELQTLLEQGQAGQTALGFLVPKGPEAFEGSIEAMENNEGWVHLAGTVATAMERNKNYVETVLGAIDIFNNEECPKSDSRYQQAVDLLLGLNMAKATVDSMAVQAQTINSVLQSVGSTLAYQVANENAANSLKTAAAEAKAATAAYSVANAVADLSIRAGYIAQSCEITRNAVRAGQAEVVEFTQRLETSSGSPATSGLPHIPSGPGANGHHVGRFISSLWNSESVRAWFSADAGDYSIVDRASDRFVTLMDVICKTGAFNSVQYPRRMMFVRKTIAGDDLSLLKSQGFVKFAVELDDLVAASADFAKWAYRLSGTSYLYYDDVNDSYSWKGLRAPVVLDAVYSGCWGDPSAGDPCCIGDGCRAPLGSSDPALTRLATASFPSPSGCGDTSEWSLSQSPMDVGGLADLPVQEVRTCMLPGTTSPVLDTIDSVATEVLSNPDEVLASSRTALCELSPRDIYLRGFRGSPLFGDWSVAQNVEVARQLLSHQIDDLDGNCVPGPNKQCDGLVSPLIDVEWSQANAGLTGVEVIIVVGMDELADSDTSPYEQSDYRNAEWRDWGIPED